MAINAVKQLLTILLIHACCALMAQTAPSKYWVQFTDKAGSPYSINNPSQYLSAKALQRRTNQNIAVVENDLPPNPHYVDSILNSAADIQFIHRSKWFNAITIYTQDTLALNAIRNYSFVQQVKSVDAHEVEKTPNKLETNFLKCDVSSYYENIYGESYDQISMLSGHLLHEDGFDGSGMLIAVIDAGFSFVDQLPTFDYLRNNNRIVGAWDFVDGDATVYHGSNHGMHVLSTIVGRVPGRLLGTAPEAQVLLLRSENGPNEFIIEEDNWVAAAEFADSAGADILNTSLGYTRFDDTLQNHTYADLDGNTTRITIATDIAASKGMLPVTSAGNSGNNSWYYISAPADADSALTVGAVDKDGVYASFSSKGPSFDGRVKPNVAGQGSGAVVASTNGEVVYGSGTSFSSPIIAGMAACLWQAHPDRTNMEILHAIEKSAHQYNNPDDFVGYGIPNFYRAHLYLSGTIGENGPASDQLLGIYPNPFSNYLKVMFYSHQAQTATIELVDHLGRLTFSKKVSLEANSFCNIRIDEDLAVLRTGTYIMRITTASDEYVEKIIKF